jgi:hypothetical protein
MDVGTQGTPRPSIKINKIPKTNRARGKIINIIMFSSFYRQSNELGQTVVSLLSPKQRTRANGSLEDDLIHD